MFHLTIFAGSEAQLPPGAFTAVTLFGGADLTLPTLAQRIVARKARPHSKPTTWEKLSGADKGLIFTLFGGTDLIRPTLMEEYAGMRALVASGAVAPSELSSLVEQVLMEGADEDWIAITLFAGCGQQKRNADREAEAIDGSYRSGEIDGPTRSDLHRLINAPAATATRAVGRMVINAA